MTPFFFLVSCFARTSTSLSGPELHTQFAAEGVQHCPCRGRPRAGWRACPAIRPPTSPPLDLWASRMASQPPAWRTL
eukprot:1444021-Alexandrium_andersonii.AAC.1